MYLAEELQSRDIEDRRRVLRGLVYEIIVDRVEDVLKCKIIIYIVSPRKAQLPSLSLPTSGPSAQRDSRSFQGNNNYAWTVANSHVSVGASNSKEQPTGDVERFLSMLRFDSKEKLGDLGIDIDHLSTLKKK